jgi:ankyrin repeat protein
MDGTTQPLFCTECHIHFTTERALKEHKTNAGAHAGKRFPCPECGKLFSRKASVDRHLEDNKCLKYFFPTTSSPSLHVAVKHMIEDDVENRSSKRYCGWGPIEASHTNPNPRIMTTTTLVATAPAIEKLQHSNADLVSMYSYPIHVGNLHHGEMAAELDLSSKSTSSAASSMDLTENLWDSPDESVSTQPTFDEESMSQLSETTSIESPVAVIASSDVTLATPTVIVQQDTADDLYLSNAMKHVSIEVDQVPISHKPEGGDTEMSTNKRSRFSVTESTMSTRSKCSVTSLGSIGSLFLNRSIRNSMSSSAFSFKSVGWRSFHSFEMAAPMLEDIDEELGRSRTQDHFWKRHDPRHLRQRMLQQGFWKQIRNNDLAGVKKSLTVGECDVNQANDQGWTPLRFASSQGYINVVVHLLSYDSIDLDFHDEYGTTALSWAASAGHLGIVKQLLDSGKVDVYLKGGVGCAAFTFASRNEHIEIAKLILARLDQ